MATKQPARKTVYVEGIAVFPSLNKPDTKYNAAGEYKTRLRVDADVAEDLKAQALAVAEAEMAAVKERLEDQAANGKDGKAKASAKKALAALNLADPAITDDVDDDGEPTGLMLVGAKLPASFESKKETNEDGTPKVIKMAPTICSASGKVLKPAPQIWSGSRLVLAIELRPYFNAKDSAVGTSLRLKGVQILELVSGGGSGNPGFKAREGYEGDDEAPAGEPEGDADEAPAKAPKAGAHEF